VIGYEEVGKIRKKLKRKRERGRPPFVPPVKLGGKVRTDSGRVAKTDPARRKTPPFTSPHEVGGEVRTRLDIPLAAK